MTVQQSSDRILIRSGTDAPDPMVGLPHDARTGLAAPPRRLPPKYFYDARGSALFEEITRLPEYYQTRTERRILERVADALVREVEPRALVEFGSGSALKTRVLLDAMRAHGLLEAYGAVEVSESALVEAAQGLAERYPSLELEGVLADFERPVALPFRDRPRLILFLGSTIGNLERDEAVGFLSRVRAQMTPADGFLIGFDLVKDTARLEAAYNDARGVTARFNLNVLRVLNRELDGDFRLDDFEHVAVYDEEKARIEMYLVAKRPVSARLASIALDVRLEEGERIRTELSHKYTADSARALVSAAGLELVRWDTDPGPDFALGLARRAASSPAVRWPGIGGEPAAR